MHGQPQALSRLAGDELPEPRSSSSVTPPTGRGLSVAWMYRLTSLADKSMSVLCFSASLEVRVVLEELFLHDFGSLSLFIHERAFMSLIALVFTVRGAVVRLQPVHLPS